MKQHGEGSLFFWNFSGVVGISGEKSNSERAWVDLWKRTCIIRLPDSVRQALFYAMTPPCLVRLAQNPAAICRRVVPSTRRTSWDRFLRSLHPLTLAVTSSRRGERRRPRVGWGASPSGKLYGVAIPSFHILRFSILFISLSATDKILLLGQSRDVLLRLFLIYDLLVFLADPPATQALSILSYKKSRKRQKYEVEVASSV